MALVFSISSRIDVERQKWVTCEVCCVVPLWVMRSSGKWDLCGPFKMHAPLTLSF